MLLLLLWYYKQVLQRISLIAYNNKKLKFIFIYVCTCAPACLYVCHICAYTQGCQKRMAYSLEPELQAVLCK